MKRIFLVRHSQSTGNTNKQEYFDKLDCDIELTETGKHQAVQSGRDIIELTSHVCKERIASLGFDVGWSDFYFDVYYSPYKRAKQSADIIHAQLSNNNGYKIETYKSNPILVERSWGQLRDIVAEGIKTENHFNFFYRPAGGESFSDTFNRVALFHQYLLTNSSYDNVIIVAHGEFNKLYLMYLLEWDIDEFNKWRHPRNGEVFQLNAVGKRWDLSSLTPLTLKP